MQATSNRVKNKNGCDKQVSENCWKALQGQRSYRRVNAVTMEAFTTVWRRRSRLESLLNNLTCWRSLKKEIIIVFRLTVTLPVT